MAVVPKHNDQQNRYDPSQDLTSEQRHRFTAVANNAQAKREHLEETKSVMRTAKRVAMKPVVKPRKDKPNTLRYAIWLIVIGVFALWVMYMGG